jgi:hypothetical protein
MRYFRLLDDIDFPNRWYLGDLSHDDNWIFTYGKTVSKDWKKLSLEVYQDGDEMDYTLTEGYLVPIVSEDFRSKLTGIKGIEFFPVSIHKKEIKNKYYVMVVTQTAEAVDESKSEFEKFEKDDAVRPDKAGDYRAFVKLVIDPLKAKGKEIFRLKKFDIAIIVSEHLKKKITDDRLGGAIFEEAL